MPKDIDTPITCFGKNIVKFYTELVNLYIKFSVLVRPALRES